MPTIGGGGEPNVGSPTVKEAAHLEGGHEGVAKGKGIRFDFRCVLTVGVGKGVATQLEHGDTGEGGDSCRECEHEREGDCYEGAGEPHLQVTTIPVEHNKSLY